MNVIERAMERLSGSNAQDGKKSRDKNGKKSRDKNSIRSRVAANGTVHQVRQTTKNENDRSRRAAVVKKQVSQQVPRNNYLARLKEYGVINMEGFETQGVDEYRRIKRPLLANAFGKGVISVERGNLIMVTSSLPGEGKTYTSINLSLSIALERDHTVLLIDTDVTRSQLSHLFGLNGSSGLTDLLLNDHLDLGQVLVRTDFPDLTVLPAGRKHAHVTELLSSGKMVSLVSEVAERYPDRVIIFDAPPLLPTTEAQVLTGLAGQIVLVVESEKTPQYVVKEAAALLDSSKAIGIVFNKARQKAVSRYYYGGY